MVPSPRRTALPCCFAQTATGFQHQPESRRMLPLWFPTETQAAACKGDPSLFMACRRASENDTGTREQRALKRREFIASTATSYFGLSRLTKDTTQSLLLKDARRQLSLRDPKMMVQTIGAVVPCRGPDHPRTDPSRPSPYDCARFHGAPAPLSLCPPSAPPARLPPPPASLPCLPARCLRAPPLPPCLLLLAPLP